jgi:PAS domain-containing protein
MQEFVRPLNFVQLLIPTVGVGVLFAGVVLYGYMAMRYRSRLYIAMTVLALTALGFVGSESMILGLTAYSPDIPIIVRFHQLEHLSGAFFLFGLPLFLGNILELGPRWFRVNRVITYAGLLFTLVCVAAVLAQTDLFISATLHNDAWKINADDYGRGKEGILYMVRDLILTVYILYTFICIAVDLRRTRRFAYLLFPIIGLVFAVSGAAVDIGYVYTGVNYDFFPTGSFSRFSLGITLFIICLLSGLTRHFIDAAKEIDRAHKLVMISEGKYRVLVEGTNDLVFTINDDLRFLSANRAALRELALPEKKLLERSFYEILHYGKGSKDLERSVVAEKIGELKRKGKPVTFKGKFLGRAGHEPREYQIRMEYVILDDGTRDILCRAVTDQENALVRFITSESQNYVIGNYLSTADELSKRLVACVESRMDPKEFLNLRVGLREILINSIEHGNLGISFGEKSEATMKGDYLSFVVSRQGNPEYESKKVTVDYRFDGERVSYSITDDGNGFDTDGIIEKASRVNEEVLAHGRGIIMALGVFDSVTYNERGNSVTLVKKLPQNG